MSQKRGDEERDPLPMDVTKEDGHWVVCGLYDESESGSDSGDEGSADTSSSSGGDSDGGGSDGSIPNPIPKSSN